MVNRKFALTLVLATILAAVPSSSLIRAQLRRTRVEPDYYRVKVVNELGEWARIGMIGYDRDANLRVELREGQHWTGNLYGGERVVVAWDRNENLIFAAEVQITGSGTLRVESALPMMAPAREGESGAAPQMRSRSPLPTMSIEPEN